MLYYDVAMGLSSLAVGAKSDGLVQIDKARVSNARYAYVHRSHSGPYGVVNSEEGYQNLRRFLFGDLQVGADLVGHRQPLEHARDGVTWQAEVRLSVRGLSIVMHEQTADHWCPIPLFPTDTLGTPTPLATTFLSSRLRPTDADSVRYALHLRLLSLQEHDGILHFGRHLERIADFDDILVIDIAQRDGALSASATWNTHIAGAIRDYARAGDPLDDLDPQSDSWVADVPLPPTAEPILGNDARIRLTVTPRT